MKATLLEKFIGSPLGLYDNRIADENTVVADKVIDVTEYCPKTLAENKQQCVIKYATVTRGRIAQICKWYEKDVDLGMLVHYHINEMTPESLAKDEVFELHARTMGADALTLAKVIFENQ